MGNVHMKVMKAGTGRLQESLAKAVELSNDGKKVLFITNELGIEEVVECALLRGHTQQDLTGIVFKYDESPARIGTLVMASKDRGYDALVLYTTCIGHGTMTFGNMLPDGVECYIYTQGNSVIW